MNSVYIYDGDYKTGKEGEHLVRLAAARHCLEAGLDFDPRSAEIVRDEKGKPYFAEVPLEFSLTHSGKLWMCMFSDAPCGLDLQLMKECDYERLADRWFLPGEADYVKEIGEEGFFQIWVRKEAYCKMTGEGLFGGEMPDVLADEGRCGGRPYAFVEIEISDEMKCAFCTSGDREYELRILA